MLLRRRGRGSRGPRGIDQGHSHRPNLLRGGAFSRPCVAYPSCVAQVRRRRTARFAWRRSGLQPLASSGSCRRRRTRGGRGVWARWIVRRSDASATPTRARPSACHEPRSSRSGDGRSEATALSPIPKRQETKPRVSDPYGRCARTAGLMADRGDPRVSDAMGRQVRNLEKSGTGSTCRRRDDESGTRRPKEDRQLLPFARGAQIGPSFPDASARALQRRRRPPSRMSGSRLLSLARGSFSVGPDRAGRLSGYWRSGRSDVGSFRRDPGLGSARGDRGRYEQRARRGG